MKMVSIQEAPSGAYNRRTYFVLVGERRVHLVSRKAAALAVVDFLEHLNDLDYNLLPTIAESVGIGVNTPKL